MAGSLKKNVVANYAGQGWRVLINLIFIPLYIKYLGIEAYGLIGIFALLQVWMSVLDMGMRPAVGREMARFTGGAHDAQSIRNLLRSIESVSLIIAAGVAVSIWAASGWLATDWLKADKLPTAVLARAFTVMGVVVALRFLEDIYASSFAGLQQQVLQNILTSIMATIRVLGAIVILTWVSPTVEAFFFWQGLISLATVALFAGVIYRVLPRAPLPARFSWPTLVAIWPFGAGMMGITLLALLLTQVDKILLSRLLTLKSFGYYAMAGVVVSGLSTLTTPITAAFYPRFTELVTRDDEATLGTVYHFGAQLVTVLVGSAALVLMEFSHNVLFLWTGDSELTAHVAPLAVVLSLGTLLNGLMWIPYQMMLAYGWTSLIIKVNAVAVAILVPAIVWIVPRYGPIGAAWIWVILNACYVLITISLMHRRLLRQEKWRWYRQDVALPLAAGWLSASVCRSLTPHNLGRVGDFTALILTACLVLASASLTAPIVRERVRHHLVRLVRTGVKATSACN